jgi:hypothetical protein
VQYFHTFAKGYTGTFKPAVMKDQEAKRLSVKPNTVMGGEVERSLVVLCDVVCNGQSRDTEVSNKVGKGKEATARIISTFPIPPVKGKALQWSLKIDSCSSGVVVSRILSAASAGEKKRKRKEDAGDERPAMKHRGEESSSDSSSSDSSDSDDDELVIQYAAVKEEKGGGDWASDPDGDSNGDSGDSDSDDDSDDGNTVVHDGGGKCKRCGETKWTKGFGPLMMFICEGSRCSNAYHVQCMDANQRLTEVPAETHRWYCPQCVNKRPRRKASTARGEDAHEEPPDADWLAWRDQVYMARVRMHKNK